MMRYCSSLPKYLCQTCSVSVRCQKGSVPVFCLCFTFVLSVSRVDCAVQLWLFLDILYIVPSCVWSFCLFPEEEEYELQPNGNQTYGGFLSAIR